MNTIKTALSVGTGIGAGAGIALSVFVLVLCIIGSVCFWSLLILLALIL